MTPLFLLQIVDRQGHVVRLPWGEPLQRDLVQAFGQRIASKSIWEFRNEAQRAAAAEQAITEVVTELQRLTKYVTR